MMIADNNLDAHCTAGAGPGNTTEHIKVYLPYTTFHRAWSELSRSEHVPFCRIMSYDE